MKGDVSVLLADDHALLRSMLEERLVREGMTIAGHASSGQAAAEIAAETQPDVVLLDIDMPGISAFEAARRIRTDSPSTRVIFLSAFIHDSYIDRALSAEVSGYLAKSEPPEVVVEAIRKARDGFASFSHAVLERIVVAPDGLKLGHRNTSRAQLLTGREREVLGYVAKGLLQKQIARVMGVSVKTVQNHIAHIMDKLEIHDRVELTRYAIREGLVEA